VKENSERYQVQPVEAVADAMMVAVYKQIMSYMEGAEKYKWVKSNEEAMEYLLYVATKEYCRQASARVMVYLKEKYQELFMEMILIESMDFKGGSLIGGWGWHDYFLVKDVNKVWYAGSPANFDSFGWYEGQLTNLIYSRNLNVVIDKIQGIEGGQWPSVKSIMQQTEDADKRIRIYKSDGKMMVEVPVVYNNEGVEGFRRVKTGLIGEYCK